MQFKNVWISSKRHLNELTNIYNRSSALRRVFANYVIPDGYPHLSMLFGLSRAPVVFTLNGNLQVLDEELTFTSAPAPMVQKNLRNIRNVDITIPRTAITSVDRFVASSPFLKHFDIPFIQLTCDPAILNGEVLLAVGGWRMGSLKSNTDQLHEHLTSWDAM